MDDDKAQIRAHATQLYAMALQVCEGQPAYAAMLIGRVEQLQKLATAIEEAEMSAFEPARPS